MPGHSIVIEAIAETAVPELVHVVAGDPEILRAASALRSTDVVRFVSRVGMRGASTRSTFEAPPAMVIALGDARVAGTGSALVGSKRGDALCVAVVIVESLSPKSGEIEELTRSFDAVLAIAAPYGVDAAASLSRGVATVTAFAAAETISLPVDEVYPFFSGGGLLMHGAAEGDDVEETCSRALATARLQGTGRLARPRVLLHVETTGDDLLADIAVAALAVQKSVRPVDLWLTASASRPREWRKMVSLLLAGPENPLR